MVLMDRYLIIACIILVSLFETVHSSEGQTSEGCGCSATSRESSSAVVCNDHSAATPVESATPPVAGAQDGTRTNEMVRIEGETFLMGSEKPIITADGEGPARNVTVDTFWMDVHEVSNAEFKIFVDATGYVTEVKDYCAPYFDMEQKLTEYRLKSAGTLPVC